MFPEGGLSLSLVVSKAREEASSLRLTPSSAWISSLLRPFDSRNSILRLVEASLIEGSERKVLACSRRADLSSVELGSCEALSGASSLGVAPEGASELSDAGRDGVALRCHSGIAGFESPAMSG
jgi:hypothetical protein